MSDALANLLQSLEEHLLNPAARSNPAAVAALLTDDFREFGSSGRIYTKPEIIAELTAEAPRQITLSDFACQILTPQAALVTYRSHTATSTALRSSLWVFRDERWRMLFHQGTRIPPNLSPPP